MRVYREGDPKKDEDDTIPIAELVKKLLVPREKRTNYDCKLIGRALHTFVSSISAFKEGWCLFCQN